MMRKTLLIGGFICLMGSLSAQLWVRPIQEPIPGLKLETTQKRSESTKTIVATQPKKVDNKKLEILSKQALQKRVFPDVRIARVPSLLKLISVTKSATVEDEATIVLIANDVWGDGTGYQMLLDADHNTYGTIIPVSGNLSIGDAPQSVYDEFEYKIPSNADGSLSTTNILIGESDSVQVPGGLYDYCIVNPDPGYQIIWIVGGDFALFDNYNFINGYRYVFEVDVYGTGDYVFHTLMYDGAANSLILPESSLSLGNSETVKLEIANVGAAALSNFNVSYRVNGGSIITETYSGTINPNESFVYTFAQKADFSVPGIFSVKAWIDATDDLNKSNDTIVSAIKHPTVLTLPFGEKFDTSNDLFAKWNVIDRNMDGSTWVYVSNVADADGGFGLVAYTYNEINAGDDYLITDPVGINTPGDYYISLKYAAMGADYPEAFEILYGTSSDPTQMTKVFDITSVTNTDWRTAFANINITTAGNYYFAIKAKSDADMYYLLIDNVNVASGTFVGTQKIEVAKIELPLSGCNFSSATTIRADISNKGDAIITGFTLKYNVNNGAFVSQSFTQSIAPYATVAVDFTTTADFSVEGKYDVGVIAIYATNSDTLYASTTHFAPITALPFTSDFSLFSGIANWSPTEPGGWIQEVTSSYAAYGAYQEVPLVSRCFTLNPGRYKVSYSHKDGYLFWGMFEIPDSYDILLGKSGTDSSTWSVIKSVSDSYTSEFVTDEVDFQITTTDDYVLAFKPTELTALALASVTIFEPLSHDVRINSLISTLSAQTPATHIKGEHLFAAGIENIGANSETNLTLDVKYNNISVGTGTLENIAAGSSDRILIAANISQDFTSNQSLVFTGIITMDATDLNPSNNSKDFTVWATDTVFATETLTDFEDGIIGSNTEAIRFGNVYYTAYTDTITSVTIGGREIESDVQVGIAVYRITETSVDSIYSGIFTRVANKGLQTFGFAPIELTTGGYFIEVQQLDATNISISYDDTPSGYFYMYDEGSLGSYSGFGNICVRANFGKQKVSSNQDINSDPNLQFIYSSNNVSVESTSLINNVTIYDISGRRVVDKQNINSFNDNVNVSFLSKGVYIATVKTIAGENKIKFVVK